MVSVLLFLLIFNQDSIPYKPSDEFEVRLDYQFKMKPAPNQNEFNFDEQKRKVSTTPLPYLILELEVIKLADEEERVRGFSNGNQFLSKRGIKSGTTLKIDMGYTTDMKDRVTPHEYILVFYDKKRNESSRIVIFVGKDGAFVVNGEKRGQF